MEHQKQKISSLSDALSDEKKRGDIDEKHLKRTVLAKERFRSKVNYYARRKAKATNTELYTRLNDNYVSLTVLVELYTYNTKLLVSVITCFPSVMCVGEYICMFVEVGVHRGSVFKA